MIRPLTAYQRARKCARCLLLCARQASGDAAARASIRGELALKAARDHGLTSHQTTRLFRALHLR